MQMLPRGALPLLFLILSACQTTQSVAGTWTGTMDTPHKLGVRFVVEDVGGKLRGQTFFEDAVTHEFNADAQFTGTSTDGAATWTTEADVVVSGKFVGNSFSGTIRFPADGDEPVHIADLRLAR